MVDVDWPPLSVSASQRTPDVYFTSYIRYLDSKDVYSICRKQVRSDDASIRVPDVIRRSHLNWYQVGSKIKDVEVIKDRIYVNGVKRASWGFPQVKKTYCTKKYEI